MEYIKDLTTAICVVVLSILVLIFFKRKKLNCPPGPYGVPLLGYLPFLTSKPHLKLIELSKKYGDVFSIKLGSKYIVVLNSADAIREALLKPEFQGRPPYGAFSLLKKQSPFFTSPIHVWQEQRKFVVKSMKDLGLGKSKIEEHVKDEIQIFLEFLSSRNGAPSDLTEPLLPSISNNISALVFGTRFPYEHPTRKIFDKSMEAVNNFLEQTTILQIFPWVRHIPFLQNANYISAKASYENVDEFLRKQVLEHKQTLDPSNIRDYMDSYLLEMKSRKNDQATTFSELTLVDSANDLFGAGSETVLTSILWVAYMMAAFPDIQANVHSEILDVVGGHRTPEFSDQKSMPYTQAVLLEIQRWVTLVPLSVLHYTTSDSTVKGYHIPRYTGIMTNLWAVHHDPQHWPEPDAFKPERFLTDDRKNVVKPQNYMPFSIGKRACPGEAMANMEMFLYFVSIVQKFQIEFPDGYKPTFESLPKLTHKPIPYKVKFTLRS